MLSQYTSILQEIKSRIQHSQLKAMISVNSEMFLLYWNIGKIISNQQKEKGWAAAIIPTLAKDLKSEFPNLKGFSERNLSYMLKFANEYSDESILQQLVAKLPWGHNILLLEKIKDQAIRFWYIKQCLENNWSRNILDLQLKSNLYERQGKAVTNFKNTLPEPLSDLANQTLKDPYIFDFLTLDEKFREKDLENQLIQHVQKFLLELGKGFAFVGNQYHLQIADSNYYIDLLFYHIKLKCYVVIELKSSKFIPEFTGKMNFYLSAVDTLLKQENDNPTLGIIICKDKNSIEAEFALRDINKPIGITHFELSQNIPENLKSSLPTFEEIEKELGNLSSII